MSSTVRFVCHFCGKTYLKAGKLQYHLKNVEKMKVQFPSLERQPTRKRDSDSHSGINGTTISFACVACQQTLDTLEELDLHYEKMHEGKKENMLHSSQYRIFRQSYPVDDDDGDDQDDRVDPDMSPIKHNAVPRLPTIPSSELKDTLRSHDGAIIYSCNSQNHSREEQIRTIKLTKALDLEPLAIINANGKEFNALTHKDLAKIFVFNQESCTFRPSVNLKRKISSLEKDDEDENWSLEPSIALILKNCKYSDHFAKQKYIEVDDTISEMMNTDWTFHPQLRYACARLLAGSIIMNKNGNALLVNTVEIYGRTRTVDSHYERFWFSSKQPLKSTLPPLQSCYKNVWPTNISDADGLKLIIATKTFGALVTSSLRLDDSTIGAELGPTTSSMNFEKRQLSTTSRIFMNHESLLAAQKMIDTSDVTEIEPSNVIYQLRQVRNKFHHISTYERCRSTYAPFSNHCLQPLTIWTYCDYDGRANTDETDGRMASKLFRDIAIEMVKFGPSASISRRSVADIMAPCKENGNVLKTMQNIMSMFATAQSGSASTMMIYQNAQLNKELESLAAILASYLNAANKSISPHLMCILEDS
ncbi:hypothetical protein NQZ79_g3809 [Umbelopsis isabellina]|nr:hypothetical protein NQZ79_g3809 [Umbelopsis isabellina]